MNTALRAAECRVVLGQTTAIITVPPTLAKFSVPTQPEQFW